MQVDWSASGTRSWTRVDADLVVEVAEADVVRVECSIPSEGLPLEAIRIYPESDGNPIQVLSIDLQLGDAAGRRTLRRIGSAAEELENLECEGFRRVPINDVPYFVAISETPCLTIRTEPEKPAPTERYHLHIRILVLDRKWLASFRRDFLDQLQSAESAVNALQATVARLQHDNQRLAEQAAELQVLKLSRVWRLAESVRRLLYGRLLAGFPQLRRRLLGVSREGVRRRAAQQDTRLTGALVGNAITHTPRDDAYQALVRAWDAGRPQPSQVEEMIAGFGAKPLVSVIMPVFNTPREWLQAAVESVLTQSYGNFELCICDDASTLEETRDYLGSLQHPRVRIVRLDKSGHISAASNAALALAGGDYVGFLDHDDVLDRDALLHVVGEIAEYDPDILYTDEDYIDADGRFHRPNFKPDFSPDLLLSHNYMTHFLVVRRELVEEVGGFDSRYDGAQDYDLVLRLAEKAASIMHIPRVLYHWRQSPRSSSLEVAAKPYIQARTRQLLEDAMSRRGIEADVYNANLPHFFYIRRRLADSPSVSIVVPFRDEPALLERCLNGILRKTTYTEFEVVGIDNQSRSPITFELMEAFRGNPRVSFVSHDHPFNFPALVNHGVANCRGDYVVLLNNDIEIITWNWIEELLAQAVNETTGAVGGKLFYPDNTIQHAGIVVGIDGYAGHGHKRFACHAQGYGNRLNLVHNVSAVTGAFMMVRRTLFESVGGFDAESFPVACNDVDFCLRLLEAGYWNVFTPYAQAYHLESASRGYEMTEEKRKRFQLERQCFVERHAAFLERGDPFYSPNLSLASESFMIQRVDEDSSGDLR